MDHQAHQDMLASRESQESQDTEELDLREIEERMDTTAFQE